MRKTETREDERQNLNTQRVQIRNGQIIFGHKFQTNFYFKYNSYEIGHSSGQSPIQIEFLTAINVSGLQLCMFISLFILIILIDLSIEIYFENLNR